MQKIKLIFYYLIIQKIPHSRLFFGFNTIRLWYVSKVLKIIPFDKNSKFENNVYISDARNLKIGKHVRINEYSFFQGKITIGDYVLIAPYVSIYTNTHTHEDGPVPFIKQPINPAKEVILGDNVWLGRNVVVLPGITIGSGSIVGANSVVTKDIEANSIVGGVPAKIIRKRRQ